MPTAEPLLTRRECLLSDAAALERWSKTMDRLPFSLSTDEAWAEIGKALNRQRQAADAAWKLARELRKLAEKEST